MLKPLKQLIRLLVFILALLFLIFLTNQTAQVVALAGNVNPLLGKVVLYGLLFFYAAVIIVPLFWIGRMPRTIAPPEREDSPAYQHFLQMLSRRLSKNPHLKGRQFDCRDLPGIQEGIKKLNEKADDVIKQTAGSVFIMTAISQYGRLDGLIVLVAQVRMIWQVVMLYNQRPTLRELVYLYSNVFAAAFLATRLENLEILEDQLEPVIASIMGTTFSPLVPAFNTAATIVTNSIIEGSANAFLTLRVGIIAKLYCASLVRTERGKIRKAAAVQAAALLGQVLGRSAVTVSKIVFKAAARAGTRPIRYGQDLVSKTSRKTWEKSGEFISGVAENLRKSTRKKNIFSGDL